MINTSNKSIGVYKPSAGQVRFTAHNRPDTAPMNHIVSGCSEIVKGCLLATSVRAAPPTAAADLAVPVLEEVLADLNTQGSRLFRAMSAQAELLATRMSAVLQRASFREPVDLVRRPEQIVDELSTRMHRSVVGCACAAHRLIDTLEPVIQRIAPHTHLLRRSVELRGAEHRLRWAISTHLARAERSVSRCFRRLDRISPENVIPRFADRSSRAADALFAAMRHRLSLHQECLRRCEQRLKAMGYHSVLGRGFSITRSKKGRRIVRSLNQLNDGQRVVTQITDGEFESEVINLKQLELFG